MTDKLTQIWTSTNFDTTYEQAFGEIRNQLGTESPEYRALSDAIRNTRANQARTAYGFQEGIRVALPQVRETCQERGS